jgi:hypothetical protein
MSDPTVTPPTAEDEAVWEAVYGFTPAEIGLMARYVEVPEEKVTRLVELARFIRTLPKPEVNACDCAPGVPHLQSGCCENERWSR